MVFARRKVLSAFKFMLCLILIHTLTLEGIKCSLLTFERIPGSRYTSELGSQQTLFGEQCLYACRNSPTCSTVSYSKKYQKCDLGTSWIDMDQTTVSPDYDILYRKDLPLCRSLTCYEFFNEDMSWNDANTFCETQYQGGHLAHVKTEKDMDFLLSLIKDTVWLGATDVSSKGTFYWTDNVLLSKGYTFWNNGEPNNKGSDNCLVMREEKEYHWHDSRCELEQQFVCQYPFS